MHMTRLEFVPYPSTLVTYSINILGSAPREEVTLYKPDSKSTDCLSRKHLKLSQEVQTVTTEPAHVYWSNPIIFNRISMDSVQLANIKLA